MKVIAIAALLASTSLSLAAPSNKPTDAKGVTAVNAAQSCPMEDSCPMMGAAKGVTAVNAAQSCPMEDSCPIMGAAQGVTAVNAAQTCPMQDSCPMMNSAQGVTAVNAAQSCPMEDSCPMMGAAKVVKAGQVKIETAAPSQCRPDCDTACCAAKAVTKVSHNDRGDKQIETEIVLAASGNHDRLPIGAKAFLIIIDKNGQPHVESIDPNDMHEWLPNDHHGREAHHPPMGLGMLGDGEGPHFFSMPNGARGFRWKGGDDGEPFMHRGKPGDFKKLFGERMGGPHDGAEEGEHKVRLGVALAPGENGLEIAQVMEGFPADGAGLEEGDVIVSINGSTPATMERLREAIGTGEVTLGLSTDDGDKTTIIRFDRDNDDDEAHEGRSKARLKFRLHTDDDDDAQRGRGRAMLSLKLKGLENKEEIAEQVKQALHEAMRELGGSLDEGALQSVEDALRSLGNLDFDEMMERHAPKHGDRNAHHPRDRMLDRQRPRHNGAPTPPPPPEARAPRELSRMAPPPARRNHNLEARFNRLEERMERIERMLESLTKQG